MGVSNRARGQQSRGDEEGVGEKERENLKTEAEGEGTVLYRDSRRSNKSRGSQNEAPLDSAEQRAAHSSLGSPTSTKLLWDPDTAFLLGFLLVFTGSASVDSFFVPSFPSPLHSG